MQGGQSKRFNAVNRPQMPGPPRKLVCKSYSSAKIHPALAVPPIFTPTHCALLTPSASPIFPVPNPDDSRRPVMAPPWTAHPAAEPTSDWRGTFVFVLPAARACRGARPVQRSPRGHGSAERPAPPRLAPPTGTRRAETGPGRRGFSAASRPRPRLPPPPSPPPPARFPLTPAAREPRGRDAAGGSDVFPRLARAARLPGASGFPQGDVPIILVTGVG